MQPLLVYHVVYHDTHFPYFVTHYIDSMPICIVGGTLAGVLFDPKYASHVYKVTVAMDNLGKYCVEL